jgi:hypothetical protein
LLSLDVNSDGLFERFAPGLFANGDFESLVAGARTLLGQAEALAAAQAGCERFVAELHDNARNVDAFLAGLP